jgi:hypothetical protein
MHVDVIRSDGSLARPAGRQDDVAAMLEGL